MIYFLAALFGGDMQNSGFYCQMPGEVQSCCTKLILYYEYYLFRFLFCYHSHLLLALHHAIHSHTMGKWD